METTFDFAKYKAVDPLESDRHYPQCKVHITWKEGGGETLWGRVVERDLVMLDNDPLDARYRYADVVQVRGDEVVKLVKRTFGQRFGFRWEPVADEEADLVLRKEIHARWDRLGSHRVSGSFFTAGLGFLLVTDAVTREEVVRVMTEGGSPITDMAVELPNRKFERVYLRPAQAEG